MGEAARSGDTNANSKGKVKTTAAQGEFQESGWVSEAEAAHSLVPQFS